MDGSDNVDVNDSREDPLLKYSMDTCNAIVSEGTKTMSDEFKKAIGIQLGSNSTSDEAATEHLAVVQTCSHVRRVTSKLRLPSGISLQDWMDLRATSGEAFERSSAHSTMEESIVSVETNQCQVFADEAEITTPALNRSKICEKLSHLHLATTVEKESSRNESGVPEDASRLDEASHIPLHSAPLSGFEKYLQRQEVVKSAMSSLVSDQARPSGKQGDRRMQVETNNNEILEKDNMVVSPKNLSEHVLDNPTAKMKNMGAALGEANPRSGGILSEQSVSLSGFERFLQRQRQQATITAPSCLSNARDLSQVKPETRNNDIDQKANTSGPALEDKGASEHVPMSHKTQSRDSTATGMPTKNKLQKNVASLPSRDDSELDAVMRQFGQDVPKPTTNVRPKKSAFPASVACPKKNLTHSLVGRK